MIGRVVGVMAIVAVLAVAAFYGVGRRSAAPAVPRRPGDAKARHLIEDAIPVGTIVFGGLTEDDLAVARVSRVIGTVRSDRDVVISPKVPSRIARIHVREGDRVRAGQLLVTLDAGDMEAQLAAARAGVDAAKAMLQKAVRGRAARQAELDGAVLAAEGQLALARAKLKQAELGLPVDAEGAKADADKADAGVAQARAGLSQAEMGLREAEDAVRRLEELHRYGGVAEVDLESARSKAAMARAAVESARAGLDLALASQKPAARAALVRAQIGGSDLEAARSGCSLAEQGLRAARAARVEALRIADYDIAAARSQVRQAEAGFRQAAASVGDGRLLSPISGAVTGLAGKPGEYAQPGMAIMRIVGSGPLYVVASVPVRVVRHIAPGNPVRVVADRSDGKGTAARIASIGDTANVDGRTVPIVVSVPAIRHGLRPGLFVTVEILRHRPGDGRVVPEAAILQEGDRWFVFVVRDGRANKRVVKIRPSVASSEPENFVVVEAGLTPGDRVVCPLPDGLHDGALVRESSL